MLVPSIFEDFFKKERFDPKQVSTFSNVHSFKMNTKFEITNNFLSDFPK